MAPKKRWRPVELPSEATDDPEFQYLSQLEELDSYEIIKAVFFNKVVLKVLKLD